MTYLVIVDGPTRELGPARPRLEGPSTILTDIKHDFGRNHMVGALVNVAKNLPFTSKKENTQILASPENFEFLR
jgi:hypothetical protein